MNSSLKIERRALLLRHHVQETLRREIVSGRLAPGQRLVEQQLCAALDVSRTVLRESLRQLEAEGLVELVPHRGAVVAGVDLDEARQIYDVRGALETLAVRGFAAHARDEDVRRLRMVLDQLERVERGEPGDYDLFELKQQFYKVLLDGCGNEIVRRTIIQLNNRISFLRSVSLSRPGRLASTVQEIRDIVSALERRDADAAYHASLRHVENAARNALEALRDRLPRSGEANTRETGSDS
jgi:DNA-binding GntR family transcriptional regulator